MTLNNIIKFFLYGLIIGLAMYHYNSHAGYILNLHLSSFHTGTEGYYAADTGELTEYNQVNLGLGLSLTLNNNLEVRGGGFKNSHDANSFYLGGAAYTSSRRVLSLGIVAGAVTGYQGQIANTDFDYKKIQPFIMPVVFINYGRVRTEIGYIPSLAEGMADTVTFTTGVRF